MKDNDLRANDYLIAFYDGDDDKCFDEDRYTDFDKAYDYFKFHNAGYIKGGDYVKLFAYVPNIGLIELAHSTKQVNNN